MISNKAISKRKRNLDILLRINENKILEIRNSINLFSKQLNDIKESLTALIAKIEREIELFASSEYSFVLENYLRKADLQQRQLQQNIVILEQSIIKLYQQLETHFAELKKLDIAKNNLLQAHQLAENVKENKLLDEMSIMNKKKNILI